MGASFVFFLVGVQLVSVFFWPVLLIYISLLTGAIPLKLGDGGPMQSAFGRLDLNAIRLLGLWLAACFVILLHLEKVSKYLYWYRFHLFFLSFCGVALIWAPSLEYGVRMLAKLTAPFLFLLMILTLVTSRAQLKRMEQIILAGGVLILFIALAGRIMGWTHYGRGLTLPATSPALFSACLVSVSMLALANFKYGNRLRYAILLICFVGGVIAAFTRITIAAMFVGFSVILFMALRGAPRLLLPAVGLAGLPALFLFNDTFKKRMFFYAERVSFASVMNDPSVALDRVYGSGRFDAWEFVLKHFFDPSPFIGSGIGATQNFYYSHSVTGLGVIHSEYIRLLSEVGLVGAALFILAAIAYLVRLARIYRWSPGSDSGRYALAATGGVVAYLIFMATDNAFDYVNAFGIYVFGLIGMSEKARELEDQKMREKSV
jgi:hypothetical protein